MDGHACATYAGSFGLGLGVTQVPQIGGLGGGYGCQCPLATAPVVARLPFLPRARQGPGSLRR
jgi:hypothetical protein